MRVIVFESDKNNSSNLLIKTQEIHALAMNTNLLSAIAELDRVLTGVNEQLKKCRIEHIDVGFVIDPNGSLSLIGFDKSSINHAGISMRIVFD